MKIEKLPSGSYRVKKMYKGKTYTVIFDYKPTQKEAIEEMAKELGKMKEKSNGMTFSVAAQEYIESKRNVLSPSTIRGYDMIIRRIPPWFMEKNVHDITQMGVQREINALSKDHGAKSVRNHHGFISVVLGMFNPNLKTNTTLPQEVKNEPYIPSSEDVKKILDKAKGTAYEVPIILACYGLHRSEICAIREKM